VEDKALRSMLLDAIDDAVSGALADHQRLEEESKSSRGGDSGGQSNTVSQKRRPLDAFVTVHAALSGGAGGQQQQVSLSAHACAMPFATPLPPVTLEVRGEGRADPEVKHSQWLWDRQELERYRIGAGGEVALSRPLPGGKGREVLEGLVTNLFVFRRGRWVTAGGGVLKGHVRGLVLGAASALGVEVCEDEPLRLDEVHTWEEAFLTGEGV
jgi:hypothetical protein